MAEQSLPSDLPARFLRGTTTAAENRDVVRRLLLRELDTIDPPDSDAEGSASLYAGCFDRVLAFAADAAQTLAGERRDAETLAREIEAALERSEPTREIEAALARQVDTEPRFHNRSLAQELCQSSFEAGLEEPERSLRLARLAVAVATRSARAADRLDADLVGAAWAQLGNALRIASRLHEAAAALATAARHLDAGTGDPLARARLLGLMATLAKDRSQLREGIARARKAARLFARVGDTHGRGKMLVVEADLHARRGEIPTAIGCLDRALGTLDTAAEPRLGLVLLHNLASYLDQQERYDEAWQRLEQARTLAGVRGHRLDLVRLRWLEGRIAAHLGRAAHAEQCWREAQTTFVELGVPYDAALVMLELAALLVRQGRHAEVRAQVEEMVPVFESQDLHGEAQAALEVFSDAVRSRSAGLELIQQVAERLEKARNYDPLGF